MKTRLLLAASTLFLTGCDPEFDLATVTTTQPIVFEDGESVRLNVDRLVGTVWKYRAYDPDQGIEGDNRHLLFFSRVENGYVANLISLDGLVNPRYATENGQDANYAAVVDPLAHRFPQALWGSPHGVVSQFEVGSLNYVGFYSLPGAGQEMRYVTRISASKLSRADAKSGDLSGNWITDANPVLLFDTAPDVLVDHLSGSSSSLFSEALDSEQLVWVATNLPVPTDRADRATINRLTRALR